ncbi:GNAT family N-acetyltransferase [Sedimentibacter sp. zth1]|uniref:GNAT family N-acetyltransferase n=1 Tax=Sedimentibacter sp. zth1 TaxID=2816908 RepID=UPI001A90DD81|nr:GNAT family N-acetyltransferase [Sedimentibacter sp. zth1]QSX05115.1 GNAT family N-acetyltransferase [Sedimentibacter sp. zth1]
MKIEKNNFNIKSLSKKWDTSGCVSIYHEGKCLYRDCFGLANRETGELISEQSTYLFSGTSQILLTLSLLLLTDMKKIMLTDTIEKYIPEYVHAHKIKIKDLILGESGLRDYFYGVIMPKLKEDEIHNQLDERTREVKEKKQSTYGYSFEDVFEIIGKEDLEYEPGTKKVDFSTSNIVFCKEIIERVSEMKLLDFEMKYIFEPLQMFQTKQGRNVNTKDYCKFRNNELLYVPIDETSTDLFTTTFADMEKLLLALCEGRLLSSKAWKKALTFNEENIGLGFELVNGTVCCLGFGLLGNSASLYFNRETNLCYMHLTNSELISKNINGTWTYFRKEMRDEINSFFTYPKNTRIVPYSKKNWYEALNLEIAKEQYEFVCDAKETIAIAYAYKNDHKLFIEVEGNRPVGMMLLQANKKKQEFYFSIVLIDKRYQGRGFGKIMLKWGVEYFKKQGAKELTIGVNRFNIAAQNLYKSVGFKEDLVYEEGMQLKMKL